MNKLHGDNDQMPPPPLPSLGQVLHESSDLKSLPLSTSSLQQSPSSQNRKGPPPLPQPHATVERIPVLASAPPSGNIQTWQISSQSSIASANENVGSGNLHFTPTMVASLPPPPPPPISSYSKTNQTKLPTVSDSPDPSTPVKSNRTSHLISDVDAARMALVMPVLPPPPNLNAPISRKSEDVLGEEAIPLSAAAEGGFGQKNITYVDKEPSEQNQDPQCLEIGGTMDVDEPEDYEADQMANAADDVAEGGLPRPLPLTTFATPLTLTTLARRQTQIPILIIATEAANAMAYKNQLTLTDLLQGLVQQDANVGTTANKGGAANSSNSATTLPPLRSLGKSFTWAWSDVAQRIRFVSVETIQPYSYSEAQELLSEHAKLQDQDGNLEEELNLLEDQVDNLVLSTSTSYASSSWSSSSNGQLLLPPVPQPKPLVNVQRDQAVKDAFALTSPPNLPWLLRYRHALEESTKCLPYDLLSSCPPLILLVASTREEEDFNMSNGIDDDASNTKNSNSNSVTTPYDATMACLQELYTNLSYYVPPCFQNGLCDLQMVRKEVLVLHDNQDQASASLPEANLRRDLQQNFGPQATLLRINSLQPVTDESNDLWKQGGRCGQCLSANDMALLKRYVSTTLVASCLLPAIERRIVELNNIVTDRKKGVKNVWKSLWRTSNAVPTTTIPTSDQEDEAAPSHEHVAASYVVKYRHDSIESQTRLLADTLFWCKDFESASGMYRLIKDDFKTDRAMSYYGSVHEMIALCLYQMDPYGKARDIFSHLETALLSYTRASMTEEEDLFLIAHRTITGSAGGGRSLTVPHATRLATRLCLVLSSSRPLTSGRHLEVADLLASASSQETALGAAVLLEQSSAHYYRAGMFRKYAFHMLMSGHMFRASGQDHHAFRCFTSALYIYHDYGKWDVLHHHLRSALAAQLYSLGRMALALQLFGQLIGTCEHKNVDEDETEGANSGGARVSLKSQQKFVQRFLEICQEHPKKALVGADRMAVVVPPPTSAAETAALSASQRDALRQQRLQRIVQVIRYTKGASRVLELPNVEMPCVNNSSILVLTTSELLSNMSHQPLLGNTSSGTAGQQSAGKNKFSGDAKIWEELEIATLAELRAAAVSLPTADSATSAALDDVTNRVLAQIESTETRRVIAEIDHEKTSRSVLLQRTKRSLPKTPVSRANMEPIWVEFMMRNPLGMDIELVNVQLVARLISAGDDNRSGRVCTNEDAIQIHTQADNDPSRETWTFASAPSQLFEAPEFGRSSPLDVEEESKRAWTSVHEGDPPTFVVTKPNLTLEGGSRVKVSLGLCPLIQGDLEILGVRWKVFGQVWIFHPFHIQGPLLQNTAFNRANRVRGESMLLKAKITQDMPCLITELIPDEEDDRIMRMDSEEFPFLEGQVSSWKLRISNVGTAPASRVFLKTNMPWVSVKDYAADSVLPDDWETRPTSCCVGPTGTLIELPLGVGARLKEPNVIHSGEVAEVPVLLRTSGGGGKQFFYMLLRYQLCDPFASPGKELCRWSRTMFEVPIYPSLTLTASIMPSFWLKNEHILSVEMTNYRTDRPTKLRVTLESLNLASRRYRMQRLPGQLGDEPGSPSVQLGWQERVTVHYRIVPREQNSTTCCLSQCRFEELEETDGNFDSLDCAGTRTTDFICLENAHDDFKAALKTHQAALSRAYANKDEEGQQPRTIAQIRRANTSMSIDEGLDGRLIPRVASKTPLPTLRTVHPTSLRRLCPPEADASTMNIICSWSTTGGGAREARICGEHHLRQLSVRPRKKSKGCPITITAKHPTKVSHHFASGSLRVPFEVTLRNRLVESAVDFQFCAEQPDCFELIGAERFNATLEGGDELTIPLEALVQSAGVYNLQQVRLTVSVDDAVVPYLFPLQWLVTVEDS